MQYCTYFRNFRILKNFASNILLWTFIIIQYKKYSKLFLTYLEDAVDVFALDFCASGRIRSEGRVSVVAHQFVYSDHNLCEIFARHVAVGIHLRTRTRSENHMYYRSAIISTIFPVKYCFSDLSSV